MGKINLKSYSFRAPQPDFRSGDILKRARQEQDAKDSRQFTGLVTSGWLEAVQGEGASGWGISDLIEFPYAYLGRPNFTSGLEGTYSGNDHDADGTPTESVHSTGGNDYGSTLPPSLQALIDAEDYTTWQPAIFVARVIHWWMSGKFYLGCYILVSQVNTECTEVGKITRIHYRLEGNGVIR